MTATNTPAKGGQIKQWHQRTDKMDDASIIAALKSEVADLRAALAAPAKPTQQQEETIAALSMWAEAGHRNLTLNAHQDKPGVTYLLSLQSAAPAIPTADRNSVQDAEYVRGFNDGQAKTDAMRQKWNKAEAELATLKSASPARVPQPAAHVAVSEAARDVLAERQRQMQVEGWTPESDDDYADGQLSMAAAMYAMQGDSPNLGAPADWPWDTKWWKPSGDRRNLVKAAALILADIERIDRATPATVKTAEGK